MTAAAHKFEAVDFEPNFHATYFREVARVVSSNSRGKSKSGNSMSILSIYMDAMSLQSSSQERPSLTLVTSASEDLKSQKQVLTKSGSRENSYSSTLKSLTARLTYRSYTVWNDLIFRWWKKGSSYADSEPTDVGTIELQGQWVVCSYLLYHSDVRRLEDLRL